MIFFFLKKVWDNVCGWMGSWIDKIADYIKKTYSPPEVAIMILLILFQIHLFIQILDDFLEDLSRRKK